MVREESDYLKAEIVGLKKEIAQLMAKIKEEREALRAELGEERQQLQKKLQEEREYMQKRIQEATKKKTEDGKKDLVSKESGTVKKDPKDTGTVKKDIREPTPKTAQPRVNEGRPSLPKNPLNY